MSAGRSRRTAAAASAADAEATLVASHYGLDGRAGPPVGCSACCSRWETIYWYRTTGGISDEWRQQQQRRRHVDGWPYVYSTYAFDVLEDGASVERGSHQKTIKVDGRLERLFQVDINNNI